MATSPLFNGWFPAQAYSSLTSSSNPFTLIYEALWDLLESDTDFTDNVRPANRIKFTSSSRDPRKKALQDADAPYVEIAPSDGNIEFYSTSEAHVFEMQYDIRVFTGDLRVNKKLYPLVWIIIKALSNANDTLDLDYVQSVRVSSLDVMEFDKDLNRGTSGWGFAIKVLVKCYFNRSDWS